MDHNDRQAIQGLFGKLAQAERQAPARDTEAEHFISDQIARQPGAPYYMAQTIVVQEQALNAAQARIEDLEAQARQAGQGGGFLSRMFGGAPQQPQPLRRQATAPVSSGQAGGGMAGGNMPASPFQSGRPVPGQGGGFLAGAAQTAMGVAGGVLLGNAVMGVFGNEAEAAPPPAAEEEEELADAGFHDGGWDEE